MPIVSAHFLSLYKCTFDCFTLHVVAILCGSESFIREFMLTAHQLGMTDGQYVYVVEQAAGKPRVNTSLLTYLLNKHGL